METDKHYFMVGSFVLLTLACIVGFVVWITGSYDEGKYTTYRIHFQESVSGLAAGGPVKYRGVMVGKVKSMMIEPENIRLIRVDINILKTTPIRTDTVANLKFAGITGAVFVELTGEDSKAPKLVSDDISPPPEITAQTSTLNEIMDIMPEILEKVSHIAQQVDKVFNDKNVGALGDMVSQWQKISHDVGGLTRSLKDDPSKIIIPAKDKGIPAP